MPNWPEPFPWDISQVHLEISLNLGDDDLIDLQVRLQAL